MPPEINLATTRRTPGATRRVSERVNRREDNTNSNRAREQTQQRSNRAGRAGTTTTTNATNTANAAERTQRENRPGQVASARAEANQETRRPRRQQNRFVLSENDQEVREELEEISSQIREQQGIEEFQAENRQNQVENSQPPGSPRRPSVPGFVVDQMA